jgi:hypothetical protein
VNSPDHDAVDDRLRAYLLDAVPILPAAPDRLAAVLARGRRTRRLAVLSAAVAVLAVLAGTGALLSVRHRATVATPSTITCPAVPESPAFGPDQPGRLVPPGAVAVARCEVPVDSPPTPGVSAAPEPAVPAAQPLGTDVAAFAADLNALPTAPLTARCTLMAYATVIVLVFTYTDRSPLVITVDRNCQVLRTPTRARSYAGTDLSGLFTQPRTDKTAGS